MQIISNLKGDKIMYIPEARSFDKGIELYGKNIVIVATRQNNNVIISKSKYSQLKNKKVHTISYGSLLFAIIWTLVFKYLPPLENLKFQILVVFAFIWSGIICYYFLNSKNPDMVQVKKYHAAEHKFLNYEDKYGEAPENCDELMKMSSISYRCGSTILAVIMILLTLCINGFLCIPILALKIVWIAISIFITLYLWANNKCNFLQKLVIEEPTYEEVEVAFLGGKEYLKDKKIA